MRGMAWLLVWKIKPLFLLVVTTASRNLKWNGGSWSRPKGKAGGWRKGRQNERVTCRPLRLHKDHILGLRSCLASSQNPSTSELNWTEFDLYKSVFSIHVHRRE